MFAVLLPQPFKQFKLYKKPTRCPHVSVSALFKAGIIHELDNLTRGSLQVHTLHCLQSIFKLGPRELSLLGQILCSHAEVMAAENVNHQHASFKLASELIQGLLLLPSLQSRADISNAATQVSYLISGHGSITGWTLKKQACKARLLPLQMLFHACACGLWTKIQPWEHTTCRTATVN